MAEPDRADPPTGGRLLATVMFVDIVGSTERAAELGDRHWRDIVVRYWGLVREELARFAGHEIDTAGDGFFAYFEGPSDAVRCAAAISGSIEHLGLAVRIGLHTGECELIGEKLGGIAVHVGARIAGEAGTGEILVSSTVKDLLAGSGLRLEDRGARALSGVQGEWRLFAVDRLAVAPVYGGLIRVLLADDQMLVRAGFRAILETQDDIEVVGEAGDGAEAVQRAREVRPDVVLMDIRMPGLDGIEATRRLLRDGKGAPRVLMLTTFDLNEYLYEAMKAGASGFLLKDAPRDQLINAVRTVAEGDALIAPSLLRRLVEDFVRRPPPGARTPTQLSELTERELEVLRLIARGLSNAEIAKTLFVSDATVRTHVTHILSKLNLRDRVQAVVLAYESGLVEPGGS